MKVAAPVLALLFAQPTAVLAGARTPALPDGGTPLADAVFEKYEPLDSRYSMLQSTTQEDVFSEPYPHIFKKKALNDEIYDALVESRPPFVKIFKRGFPKNK